MRSWAFILRSLDAGVSFDELGGRARVDGIAEPAQLTHSGGYPMSQQTNSGFNAPGFSVGSDDPIKTAVLRAIPPWRPEGTFASVLSSARAVGHIAIASAAKSGDRPRATSVRAPSGVRIDFSALAVGVAH